MNGRQSWSCFRLSLLLVLLLAPVAFSRERVHIQFRGGKGTAFLKVGRGTGFAVRTAGTHAETGFLTSVKVILQSGGPHVSLGAENIAHGQIILNCCWRHFRDYFLNEPPTEGLTPLNNYPA
jgi:hypothetical protein